MLTKPHWTHGLDLGHPHFEMLDRYHEQLVYRRNGLEHSEEPRENARTGDCLSGKFAEVIVDVERGIQGRSKPRRIARY